GDPDPGAAGRQWQAGEWVGQRRDALRRRIRGCVVHVPPIVPAQRIPYAGGCGITGSSATRRDPDNQTLRRSTMRTKFVALLLLALPFVAFAQTSPEGRWKTLDDETGKPMTIAEVYKATDGTLAAT